MNANSSRCCCIVTCVSLKFIMCCALSLCHSKGQIWENELIVSVFSKWTAAESNGHLSHTERAFLFPQNQSCMSYTIGLILGDIKPCSDTLKAAPKGRQNNYMYDSRGITCIILYTEESDVYEKNKSL